MRLAAGNLWTRIIEATPEERVWLDDRLSVPVTRYRPGAWGRVKWDDRRSMIGALTGEFPTGLVPFLLGANASEGRPWAIEVEDRRGRAPCDPDPKADLGWLRDYQRAAVDAFVRRGRGLIKAPTGSGKTEVIIGVTRTLPCQWLMAVHRADLVEQAGARYRMRTGFQAGRWADGRWWVGDGNLTVVTFQSVWRALQDGSEDACAMLDAMGGLLVDEVHAQAAESFYGVSMSMGNAYFRCGLSGTPLDRGDWDALRVQAAIGPIVHEVKTAVLVEAGLLSRPKVYMVPCVQSWPKGERAEWGAVYSRLVKHSAARNAILVEMAVRAAKPCLCFVDHIDHGEVLVGLMRARGLKVDFVHGSHWVEARGRAVKNLVRGHYDVLVCSVIFQEGVDIPELASVVVGVGKASVVAALQRIGRGMRTAKGKQGFEVYDVKDVGQRWLQRHAEVRQVAYEREGHEVFVVELGRFCAELGGIDDIGDARRE